MDSSQTFEICPKCGSTVSFKDYPTLGKSICLGCGSDTTTVELKIVGYWEQILDRCPFCEAESEYSKLLEEDTVVIYKCEKCSNLNGYMILETDDNWSEPSNASYNPLTVKIAEQEGRMLGYSPSKAKKLAKILQSKKRKERKKKNLIEESLEQLDSLTGDKLHELQANIKPEAIELAKERTKEFVSKKSQITAKQLNSIFAAELSLTQKSTQRINTICFAEKITDCQLEKIFDVTRKTIRKWRNLLR